MAGLSLWAQSTDEVLDELPQKLRLPPGLDETLPLNKTASFFGDALHAVDCTEDKDLPYGTCGNQLFGGLVMTDSHLNGSIRIRFYAPVNDVAHFEVIHGTLHGDDGHHAHFQAADSRVRLERSDQQIDYSRVRAIVVAAADRSHESVDRGNPDAVRGASDGDPPGRYSLRIGGTRSCGAAYTQCLDRAFGNRVGSCAENGIR